MNSPFQTLSYLLTALLLVLVSCSTPYQPEDDPDKEQEEEQEEQIEQNDPVAADGVLEAVTWNLLGFGTGFTGPSNWDLQTKNIVEVVDSLDADLYAFQEVADQEALNNIIQYMDGYSGFTASHVPRDQKMGFVYNTNTIDSLEAGSIEDVREEYQNDWSYYWANGRTPLFFRFNYKYENTTPQEFYAVVIHAKAHTGGSSQEYAESYERRKKAAEGLYYYLQENKPNANVILLGDYNDDVDESIYYEETPDNYAQTPYYQFTNDADDFDVLTKKLSDAGESASINYEDLIDHITISDELFDEHVQNSTLIHDPRSYIENYGNTTSDHLPVWAKFDIRTTAKSVINK